MEQNYVTVTLCNICRLSYVTSVTCNLWERKCVDTTGTVPVQCENGNIVTVISDGFGSYLLTCLSIRN